MPNFLSQYKHLDKAVVFIIIAEFFVQLIDYSYLTILMVFMNKSGYMDYKAADFYGYRFLSVLLLSFSLGFYINGRKLKPLFYISAICTPVLSFMMIYAVEYHIDWGIYILMFLLGISVLGLEVSILPYILRNVEEEHHTAAISLSYSTMSLSGIVSGALIYFLSTINPEFFDEKMILKIISIVSLIGIYFVYSAKKQEFYVPILKRSRYDFRDIKWWLIVKAMIPTTLIATGAGLVIPFMGLFFFKIHTIDSYQYAALSSFTTLIVFGMTIFVPNIKKKFGYKTTIVVSQSLAVACLVGLALTEFHSAYMYTGAIAIACFILRQPLMNIAMPITSEITMKYVGFRHREIVSALTAAIWSGSWFFSSNIFRILRTHEVPYAHIFFITAALYIFSICWYYYLITVYENVPPEVPTKMKKKWEK
ncbi:MAG: MFS transporter [Bacteroidetes bacterium]|nr:MAG: MFS transporter [Bacteroidota bacterium]